MREAWVLTRGVVAAAGVADDATMKMARSARAAACFLM
jgi:hypothetical protein